MFFYGVPRFRRTCVRHFDVKEDCLAYAKGNSKIIWAPSHFSLCKQAYKPKHLNPVNIPPISKAVLLREHHDAEYDKIKAVLLREHHDAEYDKIMGAQNMSSVEQRQGNSGMLVYLGFTPVSYDMRSCGQQRRDFMQRQVTQSVQICSLSSRVMIGQRLQK